MCFGLILRLLMFQGVDTMGRVNVWNQVRSSSAFIVISPKQNELVCLTFIFCNHSSVLFALLGIQSMK